MDPLKRRELFGEFLRRTVAEYEFGLGHLMLIGAGFVYRPVPMRHIEELLGIKSEPGQGLFLTPAQFDQCFHELTVNPSHLPIEQCFIILSQYIKVSQWLINGRAVPTMSSLDLSYGTHPRLNTNLGFETVEQYRFVQGALAELQICRLKDTHLRLAKSEMPRCSASNQPSSLA